MAVKIKYKFKDETRPYSCVVSYQQYLNFKNLPIVAECKIINSNQSLTQDDLTEMQNALDKAFQNNTTHIKNLSV